MNHKLTLIVLPELYTVARLEPDTAIPVWANINTPGAFVSITRTTDELSIICPDAAVPRDLDIKAERGWICFKVKGPLDFSMTGVMAGLANVLTPVGITMIAVGTYDTDYLLVRHESLERAIRVLRLDGYEVIEERR